MVLMSYQDYVGKEYEFEKGDRIPQWLFKNEDAHFGCNSLVIPLKHRVYWFGDAKVGNEFMIVKDKPVTQNCPQISWHMTRYEIFVWKQ